MSSISSMPLDARRPLVLAAHDGDALLGAGALLRRLGDAGAAVQQLALDGEAPLAYGELLVERVRTALAAHQADLLLAPSPLETDADRRALAMAAIEAVRRDGGALRIALYEIGSPGRPTAWLALGDLLDWKRAQAMPRGDGAAVIALNLFRGRSAVPATDAAEAFELLEASALADDRWSLFATEHARVAVRGEALDGRDRPLVSVLIRSMDRPSLADALDSVAVQTYPNLEVVVVEACGPGHRRLGERCGRFPLRQVGTGAPLQRAAAANVAIEHAAGAWLLFLDDDDCLSAAHIARLQAALAASPRHRVAYAGVRLVDAEGRCTTVLDEPFDATRLWCANFLPIHAVMFARALVTPERRFDETMPVYEDWDFWQQLAQHERFLHVPGVSASYRLIGDSGLSAEKDAALAKTWREAFYRKWLPRLPVEGLERLGAHAEHARAAERQLRTVAEAAEQALAASRAEAAGLHQRLDTALAQHAQLAQQLAEQSASAAREHAAAKAEEASLRAQLTSTTEAYGRLEQGYHQVTGSMSWRVTAPLRTVRGGVARLALRERAAGLLRTLSHIVPAPLRHRLRLRLATSAGGARALRWLAPRPAAAGASAAADAPVFDKEAVRAEAEAQLGDFLVAGARLRFAESAAPRVSVIIVLYNQAGLSLLCLQALAALQAPEFELLIVDNASSDRMPQLLDRIDGATILRQSDNLGFLRAVNLAARQARGEHLLLLNNDAVVFPDTLANAVARLDGEADAGAVGGPILLWDGRLQEAGSIVWRDGACLGYGRGESPDAGPYRFLRDVDYCSGAFLMVRRALFEQLGGFDERFAPAYYEESDLCVRLWEAGHRVVFDPRVRVRHFEFASDVGSGNAMALQARNRERFVEKHAAFLAGQCMPSPANLLQARQRLRAGTPRVLVIDDRVPLPSLGRGYPRAAALAEALVRAGAFVTHYPLLFPEEDWAAVPQALPETVEVMQGLGTAGLADFLHQRRGSYDIVLVSRPHNMELVQAIRRRSADALGGARLVYDAEALFSLRDIARAAVRGSPLAPLEQRRRIAEEMALAEGSDAIVAVSDAEARHFRAAGRAEVHVLGHALVPTPTTTAFEQRRGFLFVGATEGDESPNTDSLLWFVREVWPLVCAELGDDAQLDVVGPCESASVRALQDQRIRVHGRVDAVEPFYERARVFIVPTRFAAGIPHKAHEAAANGVPMVVSPLIADQLGWHDAALPRAADARGFAAGCVALHRDREAWLAARRYLLDAVERDCAPQVFERTVQALLGAAAPARHTSAATAGAGR
ncbi:glycosyltransferase [Aquabacterium humicola]|uniref:glycosyltransferase n=1 Tax=Aquabacterium humicola TaxID=3237377 RepID=UPI0025431D10|nr:glycosyltransferase [Rubrivivax pictus]